MLKGQPERLGLTFVHVHGSSAIVCWAEERKIKKTDIVYNKINILAINKLAFYNNYQFLLWGYPGPAAECAQKC